MYYNKFFTVEMGETAEQPLLVKCSDYVEGLHPHQAIAEMEEYMGTLEDALGNAFEEHSDESVYAPVNTGKLGAFAFELQLVQTFLSSFKRTYGTMH
jgi:hypothetical protein